MLCTNQGHPEIVLSRARSFPHTARNMSWRYFPAQSARIASTLEVAATSLVILRCHSQIHSSSQPAGPAPARLASRASAQVFLSQLHLRAALLNDEFQTWVASVVRGHAVESEEAPDGEEGDLDGFEHLQPKQPEPPTPGGAPTPPAGATAALVFSPAASSSQAASEAHGRGGGRSPSVSSLGRTPSERYWPGLSRLGSNLSGGFLRQMEFFGRRKSSTLSTRITGDTSSIPTPSHGPASISCSCLFLGQAPAPVDVYSAPIKTLERMQEKVFEYVREAGGGGGQWPLCANILDPVRASVVCSGPNQILQVLD